MSMPNLAACSPTHGASVSVGPSAASPTNRSPASASLQSPVAGDRALNVEEDGSLAVKVWAGPGSRAEVRSLLSDMCRPEICLEAACLSLLIEFVSPLWDGPHHHVELSLSAISSASPCSLTSSHSFACLLFYGTGWLLTNMTLVGHEIEQVECIAVEGEERQQDGLTHTTSPPISSPSKADAALPTNTTDTESTLRGIDGACNACLAGVHTSRA